MIVVALDTATPAVTSGVVEVTADTIRTLSSTFVVDSRAAAEQLTLQIQGCLHAAGRTPADVDAVVVGSGPGPFTGLRVGMATAAAYGHALDVPVYPVCTLDALAYDAIAHLAVDATTPEVLAVVTDARRREAYSAVYAPTAARTASGTTAVTAALGDAAPFHRISGPAVGPAAAIEVPAIVTGTALACGDPIRLEEMPDTWTRAPLLPQFPTADGLVRCAALPLRAGATPDPLEPLYLRRPDAVPPRRQPVSAALQVQASPPPFPPEV